MDSGHVIEHPTPRSAAAQLFRGNGEMATRCRDFDWGATALGPVEGWSQSLRTAASVVIGSRNPMFLWWGPELIQIYNDAYRPSFGEVGRHPEALGMPGRACWTDIWDTIGPQIEQVMTTGQSTWHEEQYVPIQRNGRLEDVWWTYGYSPVVDDDGRIGGTLVTCMEVTARMQATAAHLQAVEALRESESRLRAIFDGTYEFIGLLDPAGTLLEANRASLEFIGVSREEVVGRPFLDSPWFAHSPDVVPVIADSLRRAAAGEFVRVEAVIHRPSGEAVVFDLSVHPVRDEHGAVVFVVPEGRDITERHRAEAALRASEARYRMLFDSLDEGFCVIEVIFDADDRPVDYRFLETNRAFVEQTGLTDAIGRTMRELAPAHERHWFDIYGRVARTGVPIRFDAAADALGRWYDVFAFRPEGSPPCVVAILFKDVTAARAASREREALVEELEFERTRLAEVFRVAPTFLAVLRGPNHVFELVNEAYLQVVGRRDIVGKPVLEAIPEVRDQQFVSLLDGVLATGVPFVGREMRVFLQRTPGAPPEERFVDFVYQPLTGADGTTDGIVAHGTDVTEQVLARRQVERLLVASEQARAEAEAARVEAEAANRAKSDFLAVMSHELRTPLNAIGGYAELMEMGIRGPVSAGMRDDLRRLQASQRHLLGLINEVLNYAKLETGTVQYDVSELPIREALSSAESLVAPQARAKGLALHLVESPPDLVAAADPEKLRQVLVNLLSNAVKFTDRGGAITLWAEPASDAVRVLVRDTGVGIPRDKLPSIFEPFVQVRSDLTRPHEGTGLGLAISRDLARGMGGDLTVESTPGTGSVFTLTLPRVTPPPASPP